LRKIKAGSINQSLKNSQIAERRIFLSAIFRNANVFRSINENLALDLMSMFFTAIASRIEYFSAPEKPRIAQTEPGERNPETLLTIDFSWPVFILNRKTEV